MSDDHPFDAVLDAAFHEGQHLRNKAKLRSLPPDPAKWLNDAENFAESLSDEMPHRNVILYQVRRARINLANGNTDEVKFYMLQIEENHSNAEHDLWVLRVEGSAARARAEKSKVRDRAVAIMVETIKAKGLKKHSTENRPAFTAALKQAGIEGYSDAGQYKKWVKKAFAEVGQE